MFYFTKRRTEPNIQRICSPFVDGSGSHCFARLCKSRLFRVQGDPSFNQLLGINDARVISVILELIWRLISRPTTATFWFRKIITPRKTFRQKTLLPPRQRPSASTNSRDRRLLHRRRHRVYAWIFGRRRRSVNRRRPGWR
jgi:hypothetical protein